MIKGLFDGLRTQMTTMQIELNRKIEMITSRVSIVETGYNDLNGKVDGIIQTIQHWRERDIAHVEKISH